MRTRSCRRTRSACTRSTPTPAAAASTWRACCTSLAATCWPIVAAGGASGRVLEEMLDEAGVKRRSVLIQRADAGQPECAGPQERPGIPLRAGRPDADARPSSQACLAAVGRSRGDWLIASGSLPHGVPDDAYAQVARIAARKGQRFVLDTSGAGAGGGAGAGRLRAGQAKPGRTGASWWAALNDPAEQDAHAMELVRRGAARHGGGHAGRRGRPAGHARRRDPDAGDGRSDAQFGRRGRRLPGGASPSPWRAAPRRPRRWPGAPRPVRPPSRVPARHRLRRDDVAARYRQLTRDRLTRAPLTAAGPGQSWPGVPFGSLARCRKRSKPARQRFERNPRVDGSRCRGHAVEFGCPRPELVRGTQGYGNSIRIRRREDRHHVGPWQNP